MSYTYYHQQNGRSLVIISEEKFPERLEPHKFSSVKNADEVYKDKIKFWLKKNESTTYEVFPGEEDKFKPVVIRQIALMEKHVVKTIDEWIQGYILIPNEVVGFLWVSPDGLRCTYKKQDGYTQYAYYSQPEKLNSTNQVVRAAMDAVKGEVRAPKCVRNGTVNPEENNVPKDLLKRVAKFSELISKMSDEELDQRLSKYDHSKYGIPEEKDLWPSDYYEKLKIDYKLWKESKIHAGAFSTTVHNFILDFDKLKQKYNLIPKEK